MATRLMTAAVGILGTAFGSAADASATSSFWTGVCLWASFAVPHLATGLIFMYKDCSGAWDAHRLAPLDRSVPRWSKYAKCIPSMCRDLLLLLPLALAAAIPYLRPSIPTTAVSWAIEILNVPVAYVLGRAWAMAVHYVMHQSKVLYRAIHKQHHVPVKELCAFAAFRDHPAEFILMELPGSFFFGPVLLQLHWPVTAALLAYHGISSAIDHSGFHINWILDSRYHIAHHIHLTANYAEMEILDKCMGTYKAA